MGNELTFASEAPNSSQRRDPDLSLRVAQAWQSGVVRKGVALNRAGDLKELGRYIDSELKYFARYCEGIDGAQQLVSELKRMRDHASRRWDERSLKTMDHSVYVAQQSHSDFRSQKRGSWLDTLENS
jgi:hypothetical protein